MKNDLILKNFYEDLQIRIWKNISFCNQVWKTYISMPYFGKFHF